MADTPIPWAILQAIQARLQVISIANGYHTDAGEDVRIEPSKTDSDAPLITIYSGSIVGDNERVRGQREFALIIEAQVPVGFDNAHALVVAMTDDIEAALDQWLPLPGALPLHWLEAVYLDRPEGMPVMASQSMLRTGYRR
ncbi:hypothetical protein [Marilutibacter aestuarii]|uniref:DUF3168 domain-containing protein n=1 Tax=Marilutibacter aestuarii TaxID=1706195 RepID=A0A508AP50_9GAMM|nr:hypothetical protein [Lysobacter aestuarii]TQD51237.1 hypothetical protein FKV25_02055 [Lysobacter aestuarii]